MSKWNDIKAKEDQEEKEMESLAEFEQAMMAETDDLAKNFRERMQTENKRFYDVCNAHHYFTVCFSNEEQLIEFCNNFGLDPSCWFFDGREVARKFKKALKTPDFENPRFGTASKDYTDRARPLK